jgi:3'-phosphoadenosine 5'-phosphosulfate sulfotransferase (PAPS reductase)/FAD synthetase
LKEFHIVSISGGKDSAALAIYLKEKYQNRKFKYLFFDTGEELKDTYLYLNKLEGVLNQKIEHIKPKKSFDELLREHNNFLPSPQQRWCTRKMKIEPFLEEMKKYKDYKIYNYVGIRADEDRSALIPPFDNIETVLPFKEDGITLTDVKRILLESGIGLPGYYDEVYDEKFEIFYNRSRSGCYFCFFMRQIEWVWLYEKHPDLFKKAMEYEKEGYSWIKDKPLKELIKNIDNIKLSYKNMKKEKKNKTLAESIEKIETDEFCTMCAL